MATEVRKSKAMETREDLPEKTLNSSLTDRLDESPNPTTLSSLQSSAGDPVSADESHKEGDLSKETDPVSTGGSLSTTAAAVDGPVSDLERKMRRAERFGVRVQLSEEEKRSSRAERFGMGPTSHGLEKSKESEEHKRKARAERFGLPVEVDEEAKKKARSARFAPAVKDVAEEDKKKARAIRFSQPAISAPQVNGKGSSELNVATAGDSGGGT